MAIAERAELMVDRDDRHRVDRELPLEHEEPVALRGRGQRDQPFVPGQDVPYQGRRPECVGAVKRPALDARRASLEPHQQLAVIEQGQGLQAVASEVGDGFGVAGRVDQDRQVVRQQRNRARVQEGSQLLGAAVAANGLLQPEIAAGLGRAPVRNDSSVALIDLFEDPAESAGLVCVGGALTGSRFAGRAHLGDLLLTGLEDGAQLPTGKRRARCPRGGLVGERREGVIDAGDQVGPTPLKPSQQLAQCPIDGGLRGEGPDPAVGTALRVEPLDVANQHRAVQVGDRSEGLRFGGEPGEGQYRLPVRGDAAIRMAPDMAPEGLGERQAHVGWQRQRREVDERVANQASRVVARRLWRVPRSGLRSGGQGPRNRRAP